MDRAVDRAIIDTFTGLLERGRVIPISGPTKFNINPNIRSDVRLKPIEHRMKLVTSVSLILKVSIRSMPETRSE
ncbi:MAG: hypothetical protein QXH24_07085 [Candidatus Bathyarchaeia archaeon]